VGRWLSLAAVLWPVALGTAVWARQSGLSASPASSTWSSVLYLAASKVCHQRPDRSFFTHDVPWPVCARCSGLYLAAPIGAVAALARGRRSKPSRLRALLGIAALPTLITIAIEWLGIMPVTSLARALAALPLGAAIAFALVRVTARPEVH
jgi:uncharacterized membrane protein